MQASGQLPVLFAVIGDVHDRIGLAAAGLSQIEHEFGRPIAQVFSVGDLGLFLSEEDWGFLSGPKKYRQPGLTEQIRAAWEQWRWPLSAIGGNHEPLNRYRDWDPAYFGGKLQYCHAGELSHSIPGMRVAGLSGIFHPKHTEFVSDSDRADRRISRASTWPEMLKNAKEHQISVKRLAYYKEHEVAALKRLKQKPHLLLLHDWPSDPPTEKFLFPRRPESEIVAKLRPNVVCCGHHHTHREFNIGVIKVVALNIIAKGENPRTINPGWCALFEWDGRDIRRKAAWPRTGTGS